MLVRPRPRQDHELLPLVFYNTSRHGNNVNDTRGCDFSRDPFSFRGNTFFDGKSGTFWGRWGSESRRAEGMRHSGVGDDVVRPLGVRFDVDVDVHYRSVSSSCRPV